MKRNTKIALVMMALSAMAMGSTSAFAHGGQADNGVGGETVDFLALVGAGEIKCAAVLAH